MGWPGGTPILFQVVTRRAYIYTRVLTHRRVYAHVCIGQDPGYRSEAAGPESLAPQWNSIKLAAGAFEFLSRIGRFHELSGRRSVAGNSWKTVRSFVLPPKPSPRGAAFPSRFLYPARLTRGPIRKTSTGTASRTGLL